MTALEGPPTHRPQRPRRPPRWSRPCTRPSPHQPPPPRPDPRHRAAILSALTRGIARDVDRLPLPARLCNAFVDVFGGAGAAITLGYHQTDRLTLCATDRTAPRLEGLQEVLGEGPGWDAFTSRRVVTADLRHPTPWEQFSSTARQELGELWVCAAPMRPDDRSLGVVIV